MLAAFTRDMQLRNLSPVTIRDRLEVLHRLAATLDGPLCDATTDDLRAFQARFAGLAPASIDIYTRHVQAFYRWATERGLIGADPAKHLPRPRLTKGRPHPTSLDDLRTIFACTRGPLRLAYALGVFAGLRRGEMCALQRPDLDLDNLTMLVHGKGRKERLAPILPPLLDELHTYGLPRHGYVLRKSGLPYDPERLSLDSLYHLRGIGVETTLHSTRHFFATYAARLTRDPLFVRDLLGHESVASSEIYMDTTMDRAHERLAGFADIADAVIRGRTGLRAVR